MRFRIPTPPTLITFVAIGAVAAWQAYDLQERHARHLAEHRRYGEAVWNAIDGVAAREFRGGRFDPTSTAAAMDEMRRRFGLVWTAIDADSGETLASAGRFPEHADPDDWFEHPFEPIRPMGRGPRWLDEETGLRTIPDAPLTLTVVVDPGELSARLSADRQRMLVTTMALSLGIALTGALVAMRSHRVALRAELAASKAHLDGLETLRRLGAGLVHETKNPLGVVRGFAERIARAENLPDELRDSAGAIVDETDRAAARLDEFLLVSRPAKLRREPVAIRRLLENLVELMREDFVERGATLALACADDITLDADHDQLRRLLMNLLLNAAQATGTGHTVRLFCDRTEDRVRIGVEDDGPGVPPELLDTLFEPYVSGREGGAGLGLAIAQRIASDHGFELRHEPVTPHGARFVLEAPK